MSILSKINSPSDLKSLDFNNLKKLCDEIADLIDSTIKEEGGHYSSPLGVIELTVALHYVYDSPNDKMIWDVGHQAYPHKILTGRKDTFKSIRPHSHFQLQSLVGFGYNQILPVDLNACADLFSHWQHL